MCTCGHDTDGHEDGTGACLECDPGACPAFDADVEGDDE